jgi:hypothetical protein
MGNGRVRRGEWISVFEGRHAMAAMAGNFPSPRPWITARQWGQLSFRTAHADRLLLRLQDFSETLRIPRTDSPNVVVV